MRITRSSFLFSLFVPLIAVADRAASQASETEIRDGSVSSSLQAIEDATHNVLMQPEEASIAALTSAILAFPHAFDLPSPLPSAVVSRLNAKELAYHRETHPGVDEQLLASEFNDVADTLNAPTFAETSYKQLRALRVQLLLQAPKFIGFRMTSPTARPGDSINPYMSPLQAIHVALVMADQKLLNPDYQMDDQEWNNTFMLRRQQRAAHSLRFPQSHVGEMRTPSPKRIELSNRVMASYAQLSPLASGMLCLRAVQRLGL